jgi:endonuclease/exonuclease/phosphatase family metal-dependent hydrolase
MRQVLDLISELQPDILCLQEAFSSEVEVAIPDRMLNGFEMIKEHSGLKYSFFSPTLTAIYATVPAAFGNGIISRYPLSDTRTIFINGEYVPDYNPTNYTMGNNIRNLQIVTVQTDQHEFALANHHAYWLPDPLGDNTTMEKMKLVKQSLESVSLPLIFSGDLNVRAESQSMRVFDNFLEDLTATHHITSTLSSIGKAKNVACDHVMIRNGITVTDYAVCDQLVSDHLAIVCDFNL